MKAKKYQDGGKGPRRKVTKGEYDIEIDGVTYIIPGKMVEQIRRDGTVRKRKFTSKSPVVKIKDVTKYPKQ